MIAFQPLRNTLFLGQWPRPRRIIQVTVNSFVKVKISKNYRGKFLADQHF